MNSLSNQMTVAEFAKTIALDEKDYQWIVENETDAHYRNNSAMKKAWSSLSYPIPTGDYYFAFVHAMPLQNQSANGLANRMLRETIETAREKKFNKTWVFVTLDERFQAELFNCGGGDTMTREALFDAVNHAWKATAKQVRNIRIDEADSLVLWRALEAYRNNIVSDGFDAIESHYAPATLLLAKVMHASCSLGNSLEEGETVQTIYDDMI